MKKLLLSLYSLLLLDQIGHADEAIEPGMTTKIWQVLQKENSTTPAKTSAQSGEHCVSPQMAMIMPRPKDFKNFYGAIECEFQCQNEAPQTRVINETFDTRALYMRRGDGNLWASLTMSLKYWSQEHCLGVAQKQCKDLSHITSFEVKGLKSGEWELKQKISCASDQPMIISPFDANKGAKSLNISIMPNPKRPLRLFDWADSKNIGGHNKLTPVEKTCQKKIKAVFCYGDCITLNDPMLELLASPNPLGSDQLEICGDELLEKLGERKLSSAVLQHYCETYLLSKMKRQGITGLTCASSRIDVDCSALMP